MAIRFAAIGFAHNHIFGMCQILLDAGAELVSFYDTEPERIAQFSERYPQAQQAESLVNAYVTDSRICVKKCCRTPVRHHRHMKLRGRLGQLAR